MRVLITRPRAQTAGFADALRRIGAQAVFFPTIEIKPVDDLTCLDRALSQLDDYDWLILTSANAADVILSRLSDLGVDRVSQKLNVAAIGPKTAARLKDGGIQPDFVPDQHLPEAIIPGLGDLRGRWVLLPVADIAHDTLPSAIRRMDGVAHVVTAYHTIPAEPDPEGMAVLQDGADFITFTSGSTVRNFCILVQNHGLNPQQLPGDPVIACIGPKTAQVASESGFRVDIVADPHTTDGLVSAIQTHMIRTPSL